MKKSKKILLASSLSALALGALSVAGTFALFTDKAETKVEVGSGIVKIESKATLVNYQSSVDNTDHDFESDETSYSNALVGNSFSIDGSVITLSKMVPGDKLTVNLNAVNKSDVKTKTRFMISHSLVGAKKDLFPALKFTFGAGNLAPKDVFRWQDNLPVTNTEGVNLYGDDGLTLTIELPDSHNGEITFGSENLDNQYQDCACSIAFNLQAVQGNASVNPIDEINGYLEAELLFEGHNDTMHDAVVDMAEIEYDDLDVLDGYVYDLAKDRFVKESDVTANKLGYFKIYASMPTDQTFSIYAAGANWGAVENLHVGFDGGDAAVTSISYDRHDATVGQNVVIRTNGGELTINAPLDTVKHYGEATVIDIIAVQSTSFVEYGKAGLAKIKTGRIVVTEEAELPLLHVVETNGGFDGIKVAFVGNATLPEFSRDDVTMNDGDKKLVIEVQELNAVEAVDEAPEFIWIAKEGENTSSAVATSATVLDESTIIEENVQSESAATIAMTADEGLTEEAVEELVGELTRYAGGTGFEDDPYLISSQKHMESFKADYVYDDDWEECLNANNYKIIGDFTLTNLSCGQHYVEKGPAAHDSYAGAFFGAFDGNGHTIKYVWRDTENPGTDTVTMFGELVGAEIKDLTIDCDIVTGLDVGVISSYTYYGADLTNVLVKGNIESTCKTGGQLGGISVATWETNSKYHSYFTNVEVSATITMLASQRTTGYVYAAPFIAQLVGGTNLHFVNCKSSGVFTIQAHESIHHLYTGAFYGLNPNYADVPTANCSGNVNTLEAYYDSSCTLHVPTGMPENAFNVTPDPVIVK